MASQYRRKPSCARRAGPGIAHGSALSRLCESAETRTGDGSNLHSNPRDGSMKQDAAMRRKRSKGMDVHFVYRGQRFCWNSEKATANFRKHGIGFEQACEVFFDPFVNLLDASPGNEAREAVLGLTEDWTLLFVVNVVRTRGVIRIISARQATRAERRLYEDNG